MKEYDHLKLEKKWQTFWEKKGTYYAQNKSKKPTKLLDASSASLSVNSLPDSSLIIFLNSSDVSLEIINYYHNAHKGLM